MNNLLNTMMFFKEITKIPRESGNEKKMAEYLVHFAKERNLFYKCDEYNNVIIKKKTVNKQPIILQAHMDMVCEKNPTKEINFAEDAIEVIEKDGFLMANGTTLGADNGIGMAQILTILDSDILCNIEAVFTVAEETTMTGALNLNENDLEARELLSLDGFEENTIIIESASFYDIILETQYVFATPQNLHVYQISVTGMLGGHSGFDINKKRGNSNIELARILNRIGDIEIIDFWGGDKFNVIPSQANAQFYTNLTKDQIEKICQLTQMELRKQYSKIKISFSNIKTDKKTLNNKQSKDFLQTIVQFPHGVIKYNRKREVITSVNLGGVNLQEGRLKIGMRSSKKVEEQECLEILKKYSNERQLKVKVLGSQPGFENEEKCNLIQNLLKAHPIELFKQKPKLKSVHIALETGIFQTKMPNLQIAVISPNIQGAHTVNEKVEIESIQKTNEWLIRFLENYN